MAMQPKTANLIESGHRFNNPGDFFGRFAQAWNNVSREVKKLETRQEYREPGNPSWEKLSDGNLAEALSLLPAARLVDVPLYKELRERNVVFTRCRPVSLPLTNYLRWEIGCYDFNSAHGEQIFFAHTQDVADILRDRAHHDFMVFDDFVAFIHDYDSRGEIRGGWEINDPFAISGLSEIFTSIRAKCVPYRDFLSLAHVIER